MLRQRPGKEEPVSPLDSDEQELLVAAIAKEAKHQVTLFRVSHHTAGARAIDFGIDQGRSEQQQP